MVVNKGRERIFMYLSIFVRILQHLLGYFILLQDNNVFFWFCCLLVVVIHVSLIEPVSSLWYLRRKLLRFIIGCANLQYYNIFKIFYLKVIAPNGNFHVMIYLHRLFHFFVFWKIATHGKKQMNFWKEFMKQCVSNCWHLERNNSE